MDCLGINLTMGDLGRTRPHNPRARGVRVRTVVRLVERKSPSYLQELNQGTQLAHPNLSSWGIFYANIAVVWLT